ncbi:hypothetical protein ABZW96_35475 [Nocardia sp. NPDC004168]|uniref:hypothetical protein n=1 Tax=Nocardia sp. NPDC004168 TaxID=3154452 RepID=UPI0033B51425
MEEAEAEEEEIWWRRAADGGHLGAMSNLAALLEWQDRAAEAEIWYRKATEQADE